MLTADGILGVCLDIGVLLKATGVHAQIRGITRCGCGVDVMHKFSSQHEHRRAGVKQMLTLTPPRIWCTVQGSMNSSAQIFYKI
jgi:hypothetical protein